MKKAISPVIATVILAFTAILIGISVSYFYRGISEQNTKVTVMEFESVRCLRSTNMMLARWEIEILVKNTGTEQVYLKNVYVNGKIIKDYGLVSGGSLSSSLSIGTSLPNDGVIMKPGREETFYVWVGESLFSTGTEISIQVQNINNVGLSKNVVLT